MEVKKQVIMKTHPGEHVFNADRFGQLFSYPDGLSLASCGFNPGRTYLEKQLASISTGSIESQCFNYIFSQESQINFGLYYRCNIIILNNPLNIIFQICECVSL